MIEKEPHPVFKGFVQAREEYFARKAEPSKPPLRAPRWLKYLNFILLQWLWCRLVFVTGTASGFQWRGWKVKMFVLPLTGWWQDYLCLWGGHSTSVWSPDAWVFHRLVARAEEAVKQAQDRSDTDRRKLEQAEKFQRVGAADMERFLTNVLQARAGDWQRRAEDSAERGRETQATAYRLLALDLRTISEKLRDFIVDEQHNEVALVRLAREEATRAAIAAGDICPDCEQPLSGRHPHICF